jgi:hypothetical protein
MTFVRPLKAPAPNRRSPGVQQLCTHEGFYGIRSSYDRRRRILAFFFICERCGAEVQEVRREAYAPRFDPRGNDHYLAAGPCRPGAAFRG